MVDLVETHGLEANSKKRRRLPPITLVLGAHILIAGLLFPVDFGALTTYATFRMSAGLIYALAVAAVAGLLIRPASPLSYMVQLLKERWRFIATCHVFFVLGLTAYTTFKINIPNIIPFYADDLFHQIDLFIHGVEPGQLLHRTFPQAGLFVNFVYTRLWPVLLIGIPYALIVAAKRENIWRYMWVLLFVYMVLGNILALLLSSVGPIFYGDFYSSNPYEYLHSAIFSDPNLIGVQYYTQYLYNNFISDAPAFGTGIAAAPSVHVGVATLVAWTFTSFGRMYAVAGWIFLASIEFGSIYTGWHYALDGYISFTLVSIFWVAVSRYYKLPLLGRGLFRP